jgi:capsular exopolysaccharide synthesis family protein
MPEPLQEDQKSESLDLVKYLVLLWHWAWLIVLAVVIAAAGAFFISKLIPPVYQAKTTILVDMAPSNKSLDYNTLMLSSQLTQTYSQMLTKKPVLGEVATRLGLTGLESKTITAKPVTNTQLINIFAESTNPELAADIANMVVAVFADQVRTLQEMRFSASEQSLQAQMLDIENKIKEANDQLATTKIQSEKDRLETTIANYSQTYSGLLQSYEQVRLSKAQTLSSIVQIEPADTPVDPVRPRTLMNIAIAGVVSAILACGLIIGFDLLNDTIRTPEEIVGKLGLPVLGVISHYRNNDGIPITVSQPMSPITEAFRNLRTNVKYAGAGLDIPLRSIIVTSALPGEGKTDVLVNLGIVLAQNKLRVLLIDADLRRPALHRRLGLDNLIGLSQIFVHPELGISYSLQPTRISGLTAITAGDSPPNPSELLGSQLMGTILEQLKSNYDVLLIDTPPALAVTDAAVILPYVEGMLLVIKPGTSSMAPLHRLVTQFQQLNANMLGVVLNDINLRSSSYGYYYKHYKYQNTYDSNDNSSKKSRKNKQTQSNKYEKNSSSNLMFPNEGTLNPLQKVIKSISVVFRNF